MKKMIFTLVFSLFAITGIFGQQNVKLAVGMKAPDWMFTDADKKEFTMNSWPGKVLQINYVDPDESDMNDAFNDAVKKATDVDKTLSKDLFKGFGIVVDECDDSLLDILSKESRGFGRAGGVTEAVMAIGLKVDIKAVRIDGLNKKSMSLLKGFCKGKGSGNFIEVMVCEGGCVAGPSSHLNPLKGKSSYNEALGALN